MMRALVVIVLVGSFGCLPELQSPVGAQLACGSDDDCPADLTCLTAYKRCERRDGPCVESNDSGRTVPSADGGECPFATGAGVCLAGRCSASACGDGVVDVRLAEECDDGEGNDDAANASCLASCRLPFCGDGIIAVGESCEGPAQNAECGATCLLTCDRGFGDCNARAADGCECEPEIILETINDDAVPFPALLDGRYFVQRPMLVADGDDLWFADEGYLFRLPPAATEVDWRVDVNPGFLDTKDIALDETDVYWVINQNVAGVAKDGSTSAVFVAEPPSEQTVESIAIDDVDLFFTSEFLIVAIEKKDPVAYRLLAVMDGFVASLAVDDDAVYFSDREGGKIARAGKTGILDPDTEEIPTAEFLAEDEIDPRGAIVDAGFVYWGTGDGAIRRVPTDGGDIEEIAHIDQEADGLVMKDGSLYWFAIGAFDGRGLVYRLRLDEPGAVPAQVMSLDDEIVSVAVGDHEIWVTGVLRVFVAPRGE